MSRDILDTIDGALDDYLSADAMRWSPEPEKVAKPVLVATLDLRVVFQPFVDSMRRLVCSVESFMASLVQAGIRWDAATKAFRFDAPIPPSHAANRTHSREWRSGTRRTKRYARTAR